MELCNDIARLTGDAPQDRAVRCEALGAAVLLLAPITPHICHELWRALGNEQAVINAPWPDCDERALEQSTIDMVVQVNGKVRAKLQVAVGTERQLLEEQALAEANVRRFTDGKTIRKIIVVPEKLVNIVAS